MRVEYKYKSEDILVVCVTKSESAYADTDDQVWQNTLKSWLSESWCCMEHNLGLSGVGFLSVWNTPHWYPTCHSCHRYPWTCLSAQEPMQFKVMDLHLFSILRFFPQMESKSLAYWCENLCRYHSVCRHLTKLGLWGKIVSYRQTQRQPRKYFTSVNLQICNI